MILKGFEVIAAVSNLWLREAWNGKSNIVSGKKSVCAAFVHSGREAAVSATMWQPWQIICQKGQFLTSLGIWRCFVKNLYLADICPSADSVAAAATPYIDKLLTSTHYTPNVECREFNHWWDVRLAKQQSLNFFDDVPVVPTLCFRKTNT